jgi:limonene-1,2-epoxide hydrolase
MSSKAELAERCVLKWFELTPDMAREWFSEDAVYENKCDQGPSVVGPDEIYAILDAYRQMCERFEGRVVNIAEDGDVVLLEREELTFLKNGGIVNLPVMASFVIRDGKIAVWREYWDLALLTKQLLEGSSGEAATEIYDEYQSRL